MLGTEDLAESSCCLLHVHVELRFVVLSDWHLVKEISCAQAAQNPSTQALKKNPQPRVAVCIAAS